MMNAGPASPRSSFTPHAPPFAFSGRPDLRHAVGEEIAIHLQRELQLPCSGCPTLHRLKPLPANLPPFNEGTLNINASLPPGTSLQESN